MKSNAQLLAIATAERNVWQGAIVGISANSFFSGRIPAIDLAAFCAHTADNIVFEWRVRFAPERIGLPIMGEWDQEEANNRDSMAPPV